MMKTKEFLKALRNSNILPEPVMAKVESRVSNTDKAVSPKSLAKYLIDKGYLSRYQAQQLLSGMLTPADDLRLQVSKQESQDTDDLLRDLQAEAAPAKPAKTTSLEATRVVGSKEMASVRDPEPEIEYARTKQHDPASLFPYPSVPGGPEDPLGGFGGLGTAEEKTEEAAEVDANAFAGKKTVKNQWESRWVFIGFTTLGLLIIAGIVLWYTLTRTDVSAAWERALGEFNDGQYSMALQSLRQFVEDYPSDENVPDAKVKIANCELRIPYDAGNWDTVLDTARTVLPNLERELTDLQAFDKYEDIRGELGVILPGTALGFTRKGLEAPDVPAKQSFLALAEETAALVDDPNQVPTSQKKNPGVAAVIREFGDNMAKIKRQIEMENDYAATLIQIAEKTGRGETTAAFTEYFRIVNTYPELAIRADMRSAVAGISKREADLVNVVPGELAPAAPPPTPVQSSLVLATRSSTAPVAEAGNQILVRLVDGALWGIRASTGEILWRKHLGIESRFQPSPLGEDQDADLIGSDARNHHLFRFAAESGEESWRVQIGEPFAEPSVSADRILVTTRTGKLYSIDPDTGGSSLAAQLPQPAMVSAVPLNASPLVYQVSEHSNLYVLNAENMTCREVYYIGHRPGAVTIPPFGFSDHLIVAENGANYCRIHILRHSEGEGGMLEKAQNTMQMEGTVSEPIVRYGRWALIVSDAGDMRMLEVNKGSESDPVTVVAALKYSPTRPSRKFITAKDGVLWHCAAGLHRYKILKTQTTFDENNIANASDTFIAPPQVTGNTLFNFRRRFESTLASVSAFNSETLEEIWRTDFAAPPAGLFEGEGGRLFAVSAQGDVFALGADATKSGGTVEPQVRGDNVIQRLVFDNLVWTSGTELVAVGPPGRPHVLNYSEKRNPMVRLLEMVPPANNPSCRPVRFGPHLLVAAARGQVFRIDMSSGQVVGAPFQPEIEPNVPVNYFEPAILVDGESFVIGNNKGEFFSVVANGESSLQRVATLNHGVPLVSNLLNVSGKVVGVCRESTDQLLALTAGEESLEVARKIDLPTSVLSGPLAASDGSFLLVFDNGMTACFDAELNQLWEAEIPAAGKGGARQVGTPARIDQGLLLAFETGQIVVINPDNGVVVSSLDLGQPISGTPVPFDGAWLVPGTDGTLHRIPSLAGNP